MNARALAPRGRWLLWGTLGACAAGLLLLAAGGIGHRAIGGSLLHDADFTRGLAGWRLSGAVDVAPLPGGVAVRSADAKGVAELGQVLPIPEGRPLLRLSAEVRGRGVVPGTLKWQRGRVVLVGLDGGGHPIWSADHLLADVVGSPPWRRVSRVFVLPEGATAAAVLIQLPGSMGAIEVRSLVLEPVERHPAYALARIALIPVWAGLGLGGALLLLRPGPRRGVRVASLLVAGAVLIAVLAPIGFEARLFARLLEWVLPGHGTAAGAAPTAVPDLAILAALGGADINDVGHVVLFTLVGASAAALWPAVPAVPLVAATALFAAASELLQTYSSTRLPGWDDAGLDLAGAALGAALLLLSRRVWARARARRR